MSDMFISKKKYDAALNKAYIEGYELGRKTGAAEGFMDKHTMNHIREMFGLPPLAETDSRKYHAPL